MTRRVGESLGSATLEWSPHEERAGPRQQDVVEPEVPNASEGHPEGDKCASRADQATDGNVVPVMEAVHGHNHCDENGAENRSHKEEHLPVGGIVSGHELELGIEVERKEDESGKGGGGMSTGHRFDGIIDGFLVTSANFAGKVEALEACPYDSVWHLWIADNEEVRPRSSDKALDDDLEECSGNQTLQ